MWIKCYFWCDLARLPILVWIYQYIVNFGEMTINVFNDKVNFFLQRWRFRCGKLHRDEKSSELPHALLNESIEILVIFAMKTKSQCLRITPNSATFIIVYHTKISVLSTLNGVLYRIYFGIVNLAWKISTVFLIQNVQTILIFSVIVTFWQAKCSAQAGLKWTLIILGKVGYLW